MLVKILFDVKGKKKSFEIETIHEFLIAMQDHVKL